MKKLILLTTILLGLNTVNNAQDGEAKNFRFGLKGDLSFNWLNPEKKNELENNGVGVGYAWGLQLEFKVANNISVVSGLNMLSAAYKLDYSSGSASGTSQYVLRASEEFEPITDEFTNGFNDTTSSLRLFELNSRSVRGNYINIPLSLKMKTNEIGYMTYFGEFGVNINILTKGKVINDEVGYVSLSMDSLLVRSEPVKTTNEDLNVTKSMGLFNMGIRIGGGAEYNFSGTTSMFFALHYNHYFTNALRTKDKFLQKENVDKPGEFISAGQKAIPGAVSVTVGILF